MSIEITIEPEGLQGLVAEKSYLWAAAKRLGLRLPAECGGNGQCDTCAVKISAGAELLTPPTQSEQERLGPEKLAAGERLACQARLDHSGALTFSAVAHPEIEQEKDQMRDFQKEFTELPLQQKFATLFRLEVTALSEALNSLAGLPSQLGEMGVSFLAQHGIRREHEERTARRPAEHKDEPAPPENH